MVIKFIDWIGRGETTKNLVVYLVKKIEILRKQELEQLEKAKQKYINQGMSEEKAKVYALYEVEYIETDPETICRVRGIK